MSYIPLPTDTNGNVLTTISQQDIFNNVSVTSRYNDISASFIPSTSDINNIINVVTTGTGAATMGAGLAHFQSGIAITSSCTGKSLTSVNYIPGFEIYAVFTASFSTPTSPSSSMFIGYWDIVNDGFYVGFDGTTFGCATMSGGIQTFIPRATWNRDLLDGNPNSRFTRNGVPEALNLSNHNIWRIRFGWLGSAPVAYEILSPDGVWILYNITLQPNSSPFPSIQNPNLPISVSVEKNSADFTDLIISTSCWGGGTTASSSIDLINFVESVWTSSTALDSTIVCNTIGAGVCSFSAIILGSISTGIINFEASPDGIHWFPLGVANISGVVEQLITYDLSNGSDTWQMYVGAYFQARIRLTGAITGAGTILLEIRPTATAAEFIQEVFQATGSNLHTVIDSGTITLTNSSIGDVPTSTSIGVTSTPVLSANPLRKGAVFTNTSTNTISFGLSGNAAVLYSGITLLPYSTWTMDQFTFTTGAIAAIASGALSNLAIQEMQ